MICRIWLVQTEKFSHFSPSCYTSYLITLCVFIWAGIITSYNYNSRSLSKNIKYFSFYLKIFHPCNPDIFTSISLAGWSGSDRSSKIFSCKRNKIRPWKTTFLCWFTDTIMNIRPWEITFDSWPHLRFWNKLDSLFSIVTIIVQRGYFWWIERSRL